MAENPASADRAASIAQIRGDRRVLTDVLAARRLGALVDLDLTLHQLKVVVLVASGAASSGRDLADLLHVTAPTVSGTVDRLVELGYLVRVESPDDRRVRRLEPSDAARDVAELVGGLRDGAYDLLDALPDDDLRALAQGIRALRDVWLARGDETPTETTR